MADYNIKTIDDTALNSNTTAASQNTPLTNTLCTIIIMLSGRIGRLIAAVAIFGIGLAFFLGKITWQMLVITSIGLGTLFGAKQIAIILLPNSVVVNDTYRGPVKRTPGELIKNACPELY